MSIIAIIGTVVAALSTLYGLFRMLRKIGKAIRSITHFLDDWFGEEARPGVKERPGVMKRLENFQHDLDKIKHELWPNSGGSLRDAVDRLEKANGGRKP